MNDKELNAFLKKHMDDITKFSKLYCRNYDYLEFRQELLYDVYVYMKTYYDPKVQDNPSLLFYSVVGFLAKGVYRKLVQTSVREARQKRYLADNLPSVDTEYRSIDLDKIIKEVLSPLEQQIVYSIDYFCAFDKFRYKSVALKLGINPCLLSYYVGNIRKKIKKAAELAKTS